MFSQTDRESSEFERCARLPAQPRRGRCRARPRRRDRRITGGYVNTAVKLSAFTFALAVVFGASWVLGSAFGPRGAPNRPTEESHYGSAAQPPASIGARPGSEEVTVAEPSPRSADRDTGPNRTTQPRRPRTSPATSPRRSDGAAVARPRPPGDWASVSAPAPDATSRTVRPDSTDACGDRGGPKRHDRQHRRDHESNRARGGHGHHQQRPANGRSHR